MKKQEGIRITQDVLISSLSARFGLSAKKVEEMMDYLFYTIFTEVVDGNRVLLQGFGSFYPVVREPAEYNVPFRNKRVKKGRRIKVGFKPSTAWQFTEEDLMEVKENMRKALEEEDIEDIDLEELDTDKNVEEGEFEDDIEDEDEDDIKEDEEREGE